MNEETKNIQKFYFNEEGELVVESNKGVWVDGEQFVKMYGNFSCNARTMGIIIERLVGVSVEIGVEECVRYTHDNVVDELLGIENHTIQNYCVLGCNKERIEEYEKSLAEKNFTNKKIEDKDNEINELCTIINAYKKSHEALADSISNLRSEIIKFNEMPWYKRLFKKIEIDSVEK